MSIIEPRTPLYFKIIQFIVGEIDENRLKEGDMIPPERKIDEMFGVSRTTTRRALNELVNQGYLQRVQGKGTFVHRNPYANHYPALSSFSKDMRAQARLPEHKTLSCAIELPIPEVCRELGISENEICVHLKRLVLIENQPVGYAEIWIPKSLVANHLDLFVPEVLDPYSIYHLLENKEIGLSIINAIEVATAEHADKALAKLLNIKVGTAILVIRHVGYLENGTPCDSLKLVFCGSHYHYRTELIRPPETGWAGRVFIVRD